MITLVDIKDWLKGLNLGAEHYYIGKLDNKKNKAIGIYQRKTSNEPNIAIGGLANTKYNVKSVSMLIHWNDNANETEQASFNIFDKLLNVKDFVIGGHKINYLRLMVAEPQDVGTDDKGIYERVILFDLYYERR